MSPKLHEGWLWKATGLNILWKKRYMRLTDHSLVSYKDNVEKGTIYFHFGTKVSIESDDSCCFKLERPYHPAILLKSDTESTTKEWIDVIQSCLRKLDEKSFDFTPETSTEIEKATKMKRKLGSTSMGSEKGSIEEHQLALLHRYTFLTIRNEQPGLLYQYLRAVTAALQAMVHLSTNRTGFSKHQDVFMGSEMAEVLQREQIVLKGKDDLSQLVHLLLTTRLISTVSKRLKKQASSSSVITSMSTEFKTRAMYRFTRYPPDFLLLLLRIYSAQRLYHSSSAPSSYVSIEFGAQTYRTQVVSKSANPEWNESFLIVVHPDIDGDTGMKFTVWDDKFGDDDFLGHVLIPDAVNLATERPEARWYHLLGQSDRFERGRVNVSFERLNPARDSPFVSTSLTSQETLRLFIKMAEKSSREYQDFSGSGGYCVVWTVHEAKGIVQDSVEPLDLYATIMFENQVAQTKVSHDSSDPVWEEEGLFLSQQKDLDDPDDALFSSLLGTSEATSVFIEIFNSSRAMLDNFVGSVKIALPLNKKQHKLTGWYKLHTKGSDSARLRISMALLDTEGIDSTVFCITAPQYPTACDNLVAPILFDKLASHHKHITFTHFRDYVEALRVQVTKEVEWRSTSYAEIGIAEDETLVAISDERMAIHRIDSEKKKSQRILPTLPVVALNKLTERQACIALTEKALYIREGWGKHRESRAFQRIDLSLPGVVLQRGGPFRAVRWWSFTLKVDDVDRMFSFPHVLDSEKAVETTKRWMAMIQEVVSSFTQSRLLQDRMEVESTKGIIELTRRTTINSIRRYLACGSNDDQLLTFTLLSRLQQPELILDPLAAYLMCVIKETRIEQVRDVLSFPIPTARQCRLILAMQRVIRSNQDLRVEVQKRERASAEITAITDLSENIAILKVILEEFRQAINSVISPIRYILTWKNPIFSLLAIVVLQLLSYHDRLFHVLSLVFLYLIARLISLRNQPRRPLYRPTNHESRNVFQIIARIKEKKRQATNAINRLNYNALKLRAIVLSENPSSTNSVLSVFFVLALVFLVLPSKLLIGLMILKVFMKHFEKENPMMKYLKQFWAAAPVTTLVDNPIVEDR